MIFSKLILTFIVLIPFFNSATAQLENKFSSKELDAYNDSINATRGNRKFIPLSIELAKKAPYDYVKVVNVDKPAFYNPQQLISAYWDTVMVARKENVGNLKKMDSIMQAITVDKIGGVLKMAIIKQQRLGKKWAIVYTDSKYDDIANGGLGYWIALSENDGKSWKKYYTGLTENCNYFFKRNSAIPLWKDSATIQIEGAVVRQKSKAVLPITPAEFEVIQDSIAIILDLSAIIMDSDMDRLTDIEENKMMLNPYNKDTDGDGIVDSIDKNPRFRSVKTAKSILYEALISNFHPDIRGEMVIDLSKPLCYKRNKEDSLYMNSESVVYLFVTDDKELQGLNLQNSTMIIMTSKEYEVYKTKYPNHFIKSDYSRMYKCDKETDTFLINTSGLTNSETYVVRKTKKGWNIFLLYREFD